MTGLAADEIWIALGLGALATFIWRFAGVLLADKVPADSALMNWINRVAYSMVAGVMLSIMVFPTGILAETELVHRLIGLCIGMGLMLRFGHLLGAIIGGMGSFAALHLLF